MTGIFHFPLPLIRVPGRPVRGLAQVARIRRYEHARLTFSRASINFAQNIDFRFFDPRAQWQGFVFRSGFLCLDALFFLCRVFGRVLARVQFLDSAYSSCFVLLLQQTGSCFRFRLVAASGRRLSPDSILLVLRCAVTRVFLGEIDLVLSRRIKALSFFIIAVLSWWLLNHACKMFDKLFVRL
jgi:hypothetical protein